MSGPKSSSYTLTAQQRALILEQQRLARERELERQRFQAESEKRSGLNAKIQSYIRETDKPMRRIEELLRESGRSGAEADKLKAEISQAAGKLKALQQLSPSTSDEMKKLNGSLEGVLSSVSDTVKKAEQLSSALGESYKCELEAVIASGFTLSFAGLGAAKKKENVHLKRINGILAGIDPDMPEPLKKRFKTVRQQADEITDPVFLENFCSVVVTPFAKACRECREGGYAEAAERYRLLCAEAHVPEETFECSLAGIQKMKEASEKLEREILADRERSYIREALDAAMREMGYTLAGDKTVTKKKTGKRIRHELYTLENGTAVDVTYQDNGQISMELGGIGQTDRMPTAEESEQLTEDMRSFCGDYAELEKKLAARGVMTAHISHMPPSAEYAQIFNAGEYDLKKEVQNYQVKRKTAQTQKALHRE